MGIGSDGSESRVPKYSELHFEQGRNEREVVLKPNLTAYGFSR